MPNKYLFIVSSHSELGSSGNKTGTWLEELAAPYFCIDAAGYEITIASPKGGAAPLDPMSISDSWISDDGRRFLSDPITVAAMADTVPLAEIKADDYLGLFLAGGAATTWDFPLNPHIKNLVERYFADNKVIGGVCHGVIGLIQAVDANNEPLVKNRSITSISNAEDIMMGLDRIVPVLPEEMLRKLRANYFCAAPLEKNVAIDPPFFTGQNPASALPLGQAIVAHLERVAPLNKQPA